ncbi:MAG: isoleucine--tRNA ligase [Candidatus Andersenbacteria bacterium]
MAFKPVDPQAKLPALEHETLTFWRERGILQKTIDQRERGRPGARGEWVFYDGPPGTNGVPHVGHMLQSALKDVWPRFKTMRGYHVLRKAGWDTHGLPIELQAEKELGLDSKRDIHNYGMAKYVAYCRNTVFRYQREWEKAIQRIGRFLDTSDAYATLTNEYIQTDWWVIKQAWDKKFLYKDFKVLPYCTRCGTGLSSHEVAQGYQEVTDTSAYVKLRLTGADHPNTWLVVWTTTPWTLIANVAVAVGPEVKYVRVRRTRDADGAPLDAPGLDERLIVAEARADALLGEGSYEVEERFDGHALEGEHYEPPFDFFKPKEKAFYVVAEDFVTTEDGTGLVHLAAYGEEDFRVIKKYQLPLIQHLDVEGRVKPSIERWAGKSFKELDREVVADLKQRGLLVRAEPHQHSYPFCWRCKTPLIYDAQSSWFIKTTAFKKKMIAANKKINWQPAHIRDGRFGRWLEGNVDWAVSRSRFWGSPLPVWTCKACEEYTVVGSLAELRALAIDELPPDDKIDLHRPWIDEVRLRCSHCTSHAPLVREPDVLDCWFNAGVMPWGQWGYPAKPGSAALLESQYPADFICEAIDQTRGWFYVLLAVSTMLTGKSLLLRTGFKNSTIFWTKSGRASRGIGRQRFAEPLPLMEKFGADAVRWWMYRVSPLVDAALQRS